MNRRRILLGSILVALALSLAASITSAKQGTVKTRDGRTIEGDITDQGAQGVVVRTKVGQLTLPREEVASITYAENIQEAYEARLKALPARPSASDHLEIARWLYDNKAYDLARQEVGKALALEPDNTTARDLRVTIDRTAALERARPADGGGATRPPVATRPTGAGGAAASGVGIRDRKLLTPDDINVLRQAELRREDVGRVRFSFAGDVRNKFIQYDNLDARTFMRLPPAEQALAILERGTPEMRKDVRVVSDPPALAEWKQIQPIVLQGCATTACHGGTQAGKFVLHNPAENDAVTLTNFYILTQATGTVDGAVRKLIDRTRPQQSLLVQFGLPRDVAEFDHPDVPNWTPVFRGFQDPRFRRIDNWIGRALVSVEPRYGIEYAPPSGVSPATRPAAPAPAAAERPAQNPQADRGRESARSDDRGDTRGNTQEALDEARRRIRPSRGGVPSPGGGIGGF